MIQNYRILKTHHHIVNLLVRIFVVVFFSFLQVNLEICLNNTDHFKIGKINTHTRTLIRIHIIYMV